MRQDIEGFFNNLAESPYVSSTTIAKLQEQSCQDIYIMMFNKFFDTLKSVVESTFDTSSSNMILQRKVRVYYISGVNTHDVFDFIIDYSSLYIRSASPYVEDFKVTEFILEPSKDVDTQIYTLLKEEGARVLDEYINYLGALVTDWVENKEMLDNLTAKSVMDYMSEHHEILELLGKEFRFGLNNNLRLYNSYDITYDIYTSQELNDYIIDIDKDKIKDKVYNTLDKIIRNKYVNKFAIKKLDNTPLVTLCNKRMKLCSFKDLVRMQGIKFKISDIDSSKTDFVVLYNPFEFTKEEYEYVVMLMVYIKCEKISPIKFTDNPKENVVGHCYLLSPHEKICEVIEEVTTVADYMYKFMYSNPSLADIFRYKEEFTPYLHLHTGIYIHPIISVNGKELVKVDIKNSFYNGKAQYFYYDGEHITLSKYRRLKRKSL